MANLVQIFLKFGKICLVSILAILIPFLIICLLLPLLPFAIYRKFISNMAPLIKPKLGKMLNLLAIPFTFPIGEIKGIFMVLETDIEGGVDLEEFKADFREKIINLKKDGHLVYPELRQVFTQWMGYFFWKNAPNFSIDDHVLWWDKSPSNSKLNEDIHLDLNQIRKELLLKEFSPNKPIWDLYLLEHGGNTKIFFRWHHSYFDGISCIQIFSRIFSNGPDIVPKTKIIIKKNLNPSRLMGKFWKIIKTPYIRAEFLIESLVFYIFDRLRNVPREDGQYNMEGIRLSQSKYIPFEKLRETAVAHQVNVNSVVLAGISGGIRRFVLENEFNIRNNPWMTLISARPNHPVDKLRNHLYISSIKLPFDQSNPKKRLELIFGKSQAIKSSYFDACTQISLPLFNLPIPIFNFLFKIMPFFEKPSPFSYSGVSGPKEQLFWREQKAQFTGVFLTNNIQPLFFTSLNDAKGLQIYVHGTKSILPTEDSLAHCVRYINEEFDILFQEKQFISIA